MGSPLPESESFLSYSVRVLKSNIFPSKISEELGNIHRKRPHNVNADLINNIDVFYPFASNKIHQGIFENGIFGDTCISLRLRDYETWL